MTDEQSRRSESNYGCVPCRRALSPQAADYRNLAAAPRSSTSITSGVCECYSRRGGHPGWIEPGDDSDEFGGLNIRLMKNWKARNQTSPTVAIQIIEGSSPPEMKEYVIMAAAKPATNKMRNRIVAPTLSIVDRAFHPLNPNHFWINPITIRQVDKRTSVRT